MKMASSSLDDEHDQGEDKLIWAVEEYKEDLKLESEDEKEYRQKVIEADGDWCCMNPPDNFKVLSEEEVQS